MHTLNFMSYGFRYPRRVFWGFKPWIIPESKRFGATSPSCYSAYATSTYLRVKGTGTHRLQRLIFFLLSVSMQGKYIWNKGIIHVCTPCLLWNSLVVYVNYFAFVLGSDAGKTRRGQRAELAWKCKSCWWRLRSIKRQGELALSISRNFFAFVQTEQGIKPGQKTWGLCLLSSTLKVATCGAGILCLVLE